MKAIILAAGRGQRLRPLTDTCPKPLLSAGGKPLIVYHLEALARAGVTDIVVNTAWLAERFPAALGDGSRFGVSITYSFEGGSALETGGGLLNALPLLGEAPFLVINGDIHADVDFTELALPPGDLAHLVMVPPPAGSSGDFTLDTGGRLSPDGNGARLTYSGIALIHSDLFSDWRAAFAPDDIQGSPPAFRLAPLLRHAMRQGRIGGHHHRGHWTDAGTLDSLQTLDAALAR
ncbi:nucleotidyltransferase family protein [Xanthomonadaceae bacterium JHOS43]|nr:nucleotidyltransferase family protein [Xanthomonadaceae bacterium JHOS43]MCX7563522.1 nucleotidyltransferase family protein [Xanthomonadaceae bacterium XH05]